MHVSRDTIGIRIGRYEMSKCKMCGKEIEVVSHLADYCYFCNNVRQTKHRVSLMTRCGTDKLTDLTLDNTKLIYEILCKLNDGYELVPKSDSTASDLSSVAKLHRIESKLQKYEAKKAEVRANCSFDDWDYFRRKIESQAYKDIVNAEFSVLES